MEPVATTIAHTCQATGLGKTKVYDLIKKGSLDTVKVGRRTLVKTASIRALVGEAA